MNRPRPAYFTSSRGDCDCCGKERNLTFVYWSGIDTYACAECRGGDEDDEFDPMEFAE